MVFLLAVASALVVSFLCSVFESVLFSVSYAEIEALSSKGKRAGGILRRFKREIDLPISAILVLNTIAHTVGTAVAGATYGDHFPPETLWVFSIVFTVSILVFTEIVPKTLGVTYYRSLAAPVAHSVRGLVAALRPVLFLTRSISHLIQGGRRPPVTSMEEIRLLAAAGRAEGVVGARAARIVEGAARLREIKAREVMVPRNRVAYLSSERTLEENLAVVRDSGHSRFPFTPDNDLDHVEGVVLAKGFLFDLHGRGDRIDWKSLVKEPVVVPEAASLHGLLRTFQEGRRHLALVVDEYGGFSGVVTLEDVLEELVGEIEDESDRERAAILHHGEDGLLCRGEAEVRQVFSLLGLTEDTEAATVAGFLAERLRTIPKVGDSVELGGFRFLVVHADDRRAQVVSVMATAAGPPDS